MNVSLSIRPLAPADIARWQLGPILSDAGVTDRDSVAAVHVEDLAECLAAVVLLDPYRPRVLWSDADGSGTRIANPTMFATALTAILAAVVLSSEDAYDPPPEGAPVIEDEIVRARIVKGWAFMDLSDRDARRIRRFLASGDTAELPPKFRRNNYAIYER